MTPLRTALASLLACVCLSGCAKNANSSTQAVGDAQKPTTSAATTAAEPDASACEGRPVEIVEETWPNGNPQFRQAMVNLDDETVVPHGKTTTFWEEGGRKLEIIYVCGVRHGPKLAWHANGNRWQVCEYFNGKDHGKWTIWDANETMARQWTMIHGAWNGHYTAWYPNGQKRKEVEWVYGRKQGPEIFWDEDGYEVRRIIYADGVQQPGE